MNPEKRSCTEAACIHGAACVSKMDPIIFTNAYI